MIEQKKDNTSNTTEDKIEKAINSVDLDLLKKNIIVMKKNLVKVQCLSCFKEHRIIKNMNRNYYCTCLTHLARPTGGNIFILGKIVCK